MRLLNTSTPPSWQAGADRSKLDAYRALALEGHGPLQSRGAKLAGISTGPPSAAALMPTCNAVLRQTLSFGERLAR
jgi:hypothetical protein